MELLTKIEHLVRSWLKDVPHLPKSARTWIGDNIWWMAAIVTAACAVGALGLMITFFGHLSTLSNPLVSYYASAAFLAWAAVQTGVALAFTVLEGILLGVSIKPLKDKKKKGWTMLFVAWLLGVVSVVVSAVVTLTVLGFITNIIFGALWLAVAAYFIFEVHDQFMHVEHSKGAKKEK